jgi:Putative Ig domain
MAEHKIQGGNVLLFIDPYGGTNYEMVVCLTSVSVSDSVNVVDASSACGPDKSPGALEISYSFEGQHVQDPDTGEISGTDLRQLLRSEQTIGFMLAPEIPQAGDEIQTGTGWLSELSSTYAFDAVAVFSGVLQPYNEPTIFIEPGGGGGGGSVIATTVIANNSLLNNAAATFTPVTGSGGVLPYVFTISPALPTGLSMDPDTGEISGTPTSLSSSATYTVTITDDNSNTDSATFTLEVVNLSVGMNYQGGKVAYLDGLGGGFVVAINGYLNSVRWGVKATTGATATAIGDGAANTATITAASVGVAGANTYFCGAFTGGGYNDWVVPSYDEMQEIFDNNSLLGINFVAGRWTSTEVDADNAYMMKNTGMVSVDKSVFQVGGPYNLGLYIRYF